MLKADYISFYTLHVTNKQQRGKPCQQKYNGYWHLSYCIGSTVYIGDSNQHKWPKVLPITS